MTSRHMMCQMYFVFYYSRYISLNDADYVFIDCQFGLRDENLILQIENLRRCFVDFDSIWQLKKY